MSDSEFQRRSIPPVAFALVAIVCFFAFDRIAAAGLRWLVLKSDDRIAHVYAGGRNDDVIVLGSSVGDAMVLPRDLSEATGRSVFTMAVHGMDAITQLALVQDYLAANAPPRVALLDMRAARASRIWAPQLEMFAAGGNHIEAVNRERRTSRIPWADVFHVSRFNSGELPRTLKAILDRDDQDSGPSDGRISPAVIAGWRRGVNKQPALPDQLQAFGATLRLLAEAGTRPVVIAAPLHAAAQDQATTGLRELSPFIPSGTLVCDYSKAFADDRDFEDPAHLNSRGRADFTPMLAAVIQSVLRSQTPSGCAASASAAESANATNRRAAGNS